MKKEHSVFAKIFIYTMLLLVLMSVAAVALFSRQFLSFYRAEQKRQLTAAFQPMISAITEKGVYLDEILETAKNFANSNQSFKFMIQESDGKILFSTAGEDDLSINAPEGKIPPGRSPPLFIEREIPEQRQMRIVSMLRNQRDSNGYIFTGYWADSGLIDYRDLVKRGILALSLMLVIAILGAVLFAWKITKPLEDEIRREREMEESQRLFFSAASHELKTPIASARALVEGMIAGVGDYRDHPKYLRECLKTLDAQGHLVSEILEIVKFSDAQPRISLLPVNLAELGNSVLAEYSPLAEQKALVIEGDFKSATALADYNLLRLVLSNVISNAVQNTGKGGVISIKTEQGKHVRVNILNTGTHIPQEILPRLFDPFYRMDTARTRGSQTGLGLTIVKKALDSMKIPFALENTGEGVLFWMDLPVSS
jgi:two-component system sensor histidine kinase VanS